MIKIIALLIFIKCTGMCADGDDLAKAFKLIADKKFNEAEEIFKVIIESSQSGKKKAEASNGLAVCAYNLSRPKEALSLWENSLGAKELDGDARAKAWGNFLIFSMDTGDLRTGKKLIGEKPDDPMSMVALKVFSVLTGEDLDFKLPVGNITSTLSLSIDVEADILYGKSIIDKTSLTVNAGSVVYKGQGFPIREDQEPAFYFFAGDYEKTEKLLRRQIQEFSELNPPPTRMDKALLRLARLLRYKKEYYLSDVMIRDADQFIIRVYGDDSYLRVWPIDEKARLLIAVGDDSKAMSLIRSAVKKFPEYRPRLLAALKSRKDLIP